MPGLRLNGWENEGGRRSRTRGVPLLFVLTFAVMAAIAGCAQNTEQTQDQPSRQRNATATNQDQATQGSRIDIAQHNFNGMSGPRNLGTTSQPVYAANDVGAAAGPGEVKLAKADGATWNFQTIYIQTGGTTPTATGTTTGGATAQSPNQAGTQTPTQTVTPETSASVPIGVALPGGNVSNQATAAGRGSASGSKADAIDQTTANVQAENAALRDTVATLTELIRAMKTPTTQPMAPEFPPGSQPAK